MAFKIKNIEEFDDDEYAGYIITLKKEKEIKKIEISIKNHQICCENWGYITSEDDFTNFIGADVKEIVTTDAERTSSIIDFLNKENLEEADIMFLTILTNKGALQFAVYNAHEGYYCHNAFIKINDEVIKEQSL